MLVMHKTKWGDLVPVHTKCYLQWLYGCHHLNCSLDKARAITYLLSWVKQARFERNEFNSLPVKVGTLLFPPSLPLQWLSPFLTIQRCHHLEQARAF